MGDAKLQLHPAVGFIWLSVMVIGDVKFCNSKKLSLQFYIPNYSVMIAEFLL